MKTPAWLIFAVVAAVATATAALLVIVRAPVPELQGTAPSVITNRAGAEAEPLMSPDAQAKPRVPPSSSSSGRAARGSGIEGVTSGGMIVDAPAGR